MGQTRPKLFIQAGAGVPSEDLQKRLGEVYDLVIVPGDGQAPGAGVDAPSMALLNAIGEGVCLAGADGRILWANARFGLLGPQIREDVARLCREVAHVGAPAGPAALIDRLFEVAIPEQGRYYEVLVSPELPALDDGPACPVGRVAAVVRDVTADRRTRQKLDAIDAAGSELVRFEADVVRKLNVFERLKLLESRIVTACRDLLRFDHFAIRLIDERTGRLELVISSGLPQEATELEIYPRAEGNGISGYVAATGRSYICLDTEKDQMFLPGLAGARSSLTVPLRLHDRVLGTFDVESDQVGAFTEDDRQFAEIFGRYVAMSLHMLDLLVVERSTTNESLSDRVKDEISEPLENIITETDWLHELAARDPGAARHIDRIRADVEAIRRRVRNVAGGPQTLLGVEKAMAERRREPLFEGRRILVADDEPNMRRIIHDVLQNRGCDVTTFESGVGAIDALERAGAGTLAPFDLILSDIKMPDRNGYEVFAAARRCQPTVPVILMTGFGYDPHHSIVRASQEGLQSVLFKPFPVERLLDEVRKAVAPRV